MSEEEDSRGVKAKGDNEEVCSFDIKVLIDSRFW